MTKRPCRVVSFVVWLNGKYSNAWNRTQLCIIRHVNSNVMKVQPTTGLVRRDRPRMCEFFSRQSWRKKKKMFGKTTYHIRSSRVLQYHCNIMQKPLNYMQPFFVKCIVQSSIHLAMGPFWMANVVVGKKNCIVAWFFWNKSHESVKKKSKSVLSNFRALFFADIF